MIGIQYNGEWLDLLPETRIQLTLKSPLFAEGNIIPGSFSLPFDLPFGEASPKNTALLQHVHVVENVVRLRKIEVKLFYDHVHYKSGTLKLGKVNTIGNRISTNFQFGLSSISDDFKDKKVNLIAQEEVVMASGSYTKSVKLVARTAIHSAPFRISINGRQYEGSNNLAIATAINADTTEPRAQATYINSPLSGDAPDHFVLEPFTDADKIETPLTIDYVDDIPSTLKWSIDSGALFTAYTQPILNWLNTNFFTATPLDNRMRFPMYKNDGLYNDEKIKFFKSIDYNWINSCPFSGYLGNQITNEGFRPSNFSSLMPHIRVKWVLEKAATYFNISYEGDFFEDPDLEEALFFHSKTLDIRIPFVNGTDEPRDWIAFKRSFNTKDFVPEITFPELLKAIGARFNVAVYYNEVSGNIILKKRDPLLADDGYQNKEGYSPLNDLDDVGLVGIRITTERDSQDLYAVDDEYVVGDPEDTDTLSIKSLTVQNTINYGSSSTNSFNVPVVKRVSDPKLPLILFFYEWRTGGASGSKPLANIYLSDCDFTLAGVNGLIEKRHKRYVAFLLNRKEVTLEERIDLPALLRVDWEKKVMFDRVKFLYKQINVTLTMQEIERASVELYSTTP